MAQFRDSSDMMSLAHSPPNVERRGLEDLTLSMNHLAIIVADVGRSTTFYTDVLGLQQIQRPNFDRHGAWLTAGNIEFHLIKGTPLIHSGKSPDVPYFALNVKDLDTACQRLKEMNVTFEVTTSIPEGEEKVENNEGKRKNMLSQAFLRDPDGYYLKLCANGENTEQIDLHWLPNVQRSGLGDLVVSMNYVAIPVSDVCRSTTFYTDVLGLKHIQRPNCDHHGTWLNAGNLEICLIKGTPLVHSGENLIVCHIALDVKDSSVAFQHLKDMKVSFEVNISVPKGKGKAESEGGGRENTLSQAFLRDPDGYYYEVCNCNVLTDFAIGRTIGVQEISKAEALPSRTTRSNVSLYCLVKLSILALRAKARCQERMVAKKIEIDPLPLGDQPPLADPVILANFIDRKAVYGDICQSFTEEELAQILCKAANHAPTAVLLMLHHIAEGVCKRMFHPPAYYIDDKHKFIPEPFEVRMSSLQSTDINSFRPSGRKRMRGHEGRRRVQLRCADDILRGCGKELDGDVRESRGRGKFGVAA